MKIARRVVMDYIQAGAALIGAGVLSFGVLQYFWQIEATRADQTIELIDIWETRGYREDFQSLRDAVDTFMAQVPADQMAVLASNARAADNLRGKLYKELFADPATAARFDDVVFFFNRLGLCIEARLCSGKTARIFFSGTLENFLSFFAPHIAAQREIYPDYGNGVDLLERALK